MSRTWVVALSVVAVLPATAAAATDRLTRTLTLPPARTLSLEITVGDVRIEASTRPDAQIEIVRRAPTNEGLARMPVEIEETHDRVRIVARQLDEATDQAFRTDVTLRVPLRARLAHVGVMEGQMTIVGLAGAIEADVRRGSIAASHVSGTVRLQTNIGHIAIEGATLGPDGLLRLRTFNGNVTLALAERPANARVMALALNGTIESQIPLTMKDTWGPRWGEATIGRGEPVISIDVVTGGSRSEVLSQHLIPIQLLLRIAVTR